MRPALVAALICAACACSTTAPAATTTAAAATATASRISYPGASPPGYIGRYAIMRHGGAGVELVDEARGNVVAGTIVVPGSFRPHQFLPWVSASRTRAYLLDGGGQVNFLAPDGTTGGVTSITLTANQEASIAVSPDDQRMAVSVFSYQASSDAAPRSFTYLGMRLYVEDLKGGTNHAEIFTSTSVAEFPVGWVGGKLVVAVTPPVICCVANPIANPYWATEYHVVDPANGHRITALCGHAGSVPVGPLEPFGVMCDGVPPQFLRWDGTAFPAPAAVPYTGDDGLAVSPDGTKVLVGGTPIRVLSREPDFLFAMNGYSWGWVDATHVVVQDFSGNFWLMDPRDGKGVQLPGETGYLGNLPAAIS